MISNYLDVLSEIHNLKKPRTYLEIGVRSGRSFKLSKAESIGIDPSPILKFAVAGTVHKVTSDEYFANNAPFDGYGIEFAFIDGMHLFEYALRDFFNIEKHSASNGLIALDDTLPPDPTWATRERNTRRWTGDVWKIIPALRTYRPDLKLTLIDSDPAGTLLVSQLDPDNMVLRDKYDEIIETFSSRQYRIPPPSILERVGAISLQDWIALESN